MNADGPRLSGRTHVRDMLRALGHRRTPTGHPATGRPRRGTRGGAGPRLRNGMACHRIRPRRMLGDRY